MMRYIFFVILLVFCQCNRQTDNLTRDKAMLAPVISCDFWLIGPKPVLTLDVPMKVDCHGIMFLQSSACH